MTKDELIARLAAERYAALVEAAMLWEELTWLMKQPHNTVCTCGKTGHACGYCTARLALEASPRSAALMAVVEAARRWDATPSAPNAHTLHQALAALDAGKETTDEV